MSDHKAGGCPDGGVCHHWCADGPCFRVGSCGPLSGVFPGDQWPAALRAAGGQEEPVCPLAEAGIEHRPHHYLTPVPWDCPGLPSAPVGGQDEPSDGQIKAKLAEFIWTTSRADEGTISATGADVIAAALIRAGLAAAVSGEQPQRTADERLTAMAREYREHINAATGRSEPAEETHRKHRNELVLDRLRVQAILDAGR